MTVLDLDAPAPDLPREIDPGLTSVDKAFRRGVGAVGGFVLVLIVAIGAFLGYQAIPTLHHYGLGFFSQTLWNPERDLVGLGAVLVGTVQVALVALAVGFPLALLTALYISEYAPPRIKGLLVALVDLMAAVPSIIFGVWGATELQAQALPVSRWLHQNLGWVPLFRVHTDPDAANLPQTLGHFYSGSAFIAGLCVSMMVIPLACSVMRGVFAQAPLGEREAAYALGSTRWGMIRTVVLPFGRGGIIGGTMLALGRALGETVAVLLILNVGYDVKLSVLPGSTQTISGLIANNFGEATSRQLSALLTAGFVLFVITVAVNTVAAVFVNRSRSGAGVEI